METDDASDVIDGVEEKIGRIADEHPGWGPSKIAKELNTETYGFIRMSTMAVRKILRNRNP